MAFDVLADSQATGPLQTGGPLITLLYELKEHSAAFSVHASPCMIREV